jgi:hypothetical protein
MKVVVRKVSFSGQEGQLFRSFSAWLRTVYFSIILTSKPVFSMFCVLQVSRQIQNAFTFPLTRATRSAQLSSAQLSSAQLSSAQISSAQLSSSHPPLLHHPNNVRWAVQLLIMYFYPVSSYSPSLRCQYHLQHDQSLFLPYYQIPSSTPPEATVDFISVSILMLNTNTAIAQCVMIHCKAVCIEPPPKHIPSIRQSL